MNVRFGMIYRPGGNPQFEPASDLTIDRKQREACAKLQDSIMLRINKVPERVNFYTQRRDYLPISKSGSDGHSYVFTNQHASQLRGSLRYAANVTAHEIILSGRQEKLRALQAEPHKAGQIKIQEVEASIAEAETALQEARQVKAAKENLKQLEKELRQLQKTSPALGEDQQHAQTIQATKEALTLAELALEKAYQKTVSEYIADIKGQDTLLDPADRQLRFVVRKNAYRVDQPLFNQIKLDREFGREYRKVKKSVGKDMSRLKYALKNKDREQRNASLTNIKNAILNGASTFKTLFVQEFREFLAKWRERLEPTAELTTAAATA